MPFPDPAEAAAQQQTSTSSPPPPQTGANYQVERPGFVRRVVERVGGGVVGGMVSGAIRIGIAGFMLGALFAAGAMMAPIVFGSIISGVSTFSLGAFAATTMKAGLIWGAQGAVAGAMIVGGWKFVSGVFGAMKDAIFNPNNGAKITQDGGKEPQQGKVISPELSQALQQDQIQGTPGLDANATTRPDPNAPEPRHYARTAEERAAWRAQRESDRQELEALRRMRDGMPPPQTQTNVQQQEWENRKPIGFEQKGRTEQTPADTATQTPPSSSQPQNPIGFQQQGATNQEVSQPGEWQAKTGRTAPTATRDGHWTNVIDAQRDSPQASQGLAK